MAIDITSREASLQPVEELRSAIRQLKSLN
jgi:hypothetical protein